MGLQKTTFRNLAKNRRAFHDYEIKTQYEAGIKLVGSEVKSLRQKNPSIAEAYVKIIKGEVFLVGSYIPEFKQAFFNHEATRNRKLLLTKREIAELKKSLEIKGFTLLPLQIFFNDRDMVKVKIGLGKGKKKHDKREDLKKKSDKKRMEW